MQGAGQGGWWSCQAECRFLCAFVMLRCSMVHRRDKAALAECLRWCKLRPERLWGQAVHACQGVRWGWPLECPRPTWGALLQTGVLAAELSVVSAAAVSALAALRAAGRLVAAGWSAVAAAALRAGARLGVAGLAGASPAAVTSTLGAAFAVALGAALGCDFCTFWLSSSMRAIRASISWAEGTPSLFRVRATRSSKMLSSLSHWPLALAVMSLAMDVMRLVASEMRSSATAWVLR